MTWRAHVKRRRTASDTFACPWSREVDPLIDPRWDAYVRAHGAATLYHLGAWAAILRGAYGFGPHYLASEEAGRLTGVLPLMRKKGIVSDARLRSIPVVLLRRPARRLAGGRVRAAGRRSDLAESDGVQGAEHQHRRAAPGGGGIRRRGDPAPLGRRAAGRPRRSARGLAQDLEQPVPQPAQGGSVGARRSARSTSGPRHAQPSRAVRAHACGGTARCRARFASCASSATFWDRT